MPLHPEGITPERQVYEDDVDMVIAPGSEGYLGILPHHAPLFTTLGPGEFRVKKGGVEQALAVFGGFMDVRADRVVVLTEAAEHAEDRKSTRLNSSHQIISYAVFCLKKKKNNIPDLFTYFPFSTRNFTSDEPQLLAS